MPRRVSFFEAAQPKDGRTSGSRTDLATEIIAKKIIELAQGAAMTPMKQQIENPRCSACGDEMELTVVVPPFGSSAYGLKIFTCPKCGRSEDYLVTSPSQAA